MRTKHRGIRIERFAHYFCEEWAQLLFAWLPPVNDQLVFVIPAELTLVWVCCDAQGLLPKSGWDLIFCVSSLSLGPTPCFCIFSWRCFVPLLSITIFRKHPNLHCQCSSAECLLLERFTLSLKAPSWSTHCVNTPLSPWIFCLVGFLLLTFHLTLRLKYSCHFLVFRSV